MSVGSSGSYQTLRATIAASGSRSDLDALRAVVRALFTGVRRVSLESAIAEREAGIAPPVVEEVGRAEDEETPAPMAVAVLDATLASLETAREIAGALRSPEVAPDIPSARHERRDIVALLAQAQFQLAELRDTFAEQDARIAEWQEAWRATGLLRRHEDAYYRIGLDGTVSGHPLCVRCWEIDHRQNALIHDAGDHQHRVCAVCGTRYDGRFARVIP